VNNFHGNNLISDSISELNFSIIFSFIFDISFKVIDILYFSRPNALFSVKRDTISCVKRTKTSLFANYLSICSKSGGLAVKLPALGAKGHRFDSIKRLKLFQGLISRLTTSWVDDHVKWRLRLH